MILEKRSLCAPPPLFLKLNPFTKKTSQPICMSVYLCLSLVLPPSFLSLYFSQHIFVSVLWLSCSWLTSCVFSDWPAYFNCWVPFLTGVSSISNDRFPLFCCPLVGPSMTLDSSDQLTVFFWVSPGWPKCMKRWTFLFQGTYIDTHTHTHMHMHTHGRPTTIHMPSLTHAYIEL